MVDDSLLRDEIIGTHSSQFSLPSALWNLKAVQEAIKLRLGVDMPIRTVAEYLHSWGFAPQRLVKRPVEQLPELLRT